ncbi:hypothetical protein [Cribrihabitans pelagius]|uniref:hypothetical protein n=1 Tax=Cribrihabitans pelagius TaxID=1765746 RepID=UPI003B59A90E
MKRLWSFLASDDGAITVDWVVLSAAIIGLAVLISGAMENGAMGLAQAMAAYMTNWSFS